MITGTNGVEVSSPFVDRFELARLLKVSIATVTAWEQERGLPHYAITPSTGGRATTRYHLVEIDAWLKRTRKGKGIARVPLMPTLPVAIEVRGLTPSQEVEVIVDGVGHVVRAS